MSADITKELPDDLLEIRTRPCWICGQYSFLVLPYDAWRAFDLLGVALDLAWPEGSVADKLLITTGIHPKCWMAEYPDSTDNNSKEK